MEGILKAKNIRVPAKASIWYVGTSVISKIVGLLVTPVFTRILTGEEYGAYSLYMSYLGFFSLICTVGFSASVIYKGLQVFPEKKESFISAALGFNFCFSLLICILLFAFSGVLGISRILVLILCIQLITDSAVGLSLMEKRYYYSYRTVAFVSLFEAVGAPIISLILLYGTSLGFVAKLFGLLIPATLSATALVLGIIQKSKRLFDKEIWSYLFHRSLPLLPSVVSAALTSHVASFVIAKALGGSALAKYSVTHSVGVGLLLLISTLGASLTPWITRKLAAKNVAAISCVTDVLFRLFGAATLFLIALVPEAVAFLAPIEYSEAIYAAVPIALAALPSFITSVVGVGLVFLDLGGRVSIAASIGAVSNFLLSLILIPSLRYIGAGTALLLSSLITSAVSLYYLKKAEFGSILKLKDTLSVFISVSALGIIISLLYNYATPRFLLLLIPAFMILKTLPTLKNLIREK